tara:strand:- start:100 stop:210 length:111 start_codon:yes stop_codon:yes gene_type:complete
MNNFDKNDYPFLDSKAYCGNFNAIQKDALKYQKNFE